MQQKLKQLDPHLMYYAINITVELKYTVSTQLIYNVLERMEKQSKRKADAAMMNGVVDMLKSLGGKLESTVLTEEPYECKSLQEKIKELLRLLGCTLSPEELNQILKGTLTIEGVLSKKAQQLWMLIFDLDDKNHYRPNPELVDNLIWCVKEYAMATLDIKLEKAMREYQISRVKKDRYENAMQARVLKERQKAYETPVELEQKRRKLKLYIAHMQGYDRDRDRDGGRGINMVTGEIIDWGDIFIADKEHGAVIEDQNRDGIDRIDIR